MSSSRDEEINALNQRVQTLQQRHSQLMQTHLKLGFEKNELKTCVEQQSAETNRLKSLLQSAEERAASLETENKRIQEQSARRHEQHSADINQLRTLLHTAQTRAASLETEKNSLFEKAQQLGNKFLPQFKELQYQNAQLRVQVEQLQKSKPTQANTASPASSSPSRFF